MEDLVGKIYNRWTLIEETKLTNKGTRRFNCRCLCGTERTLTLCDLIAGTPKSCGCILKERRKENKKILEKPCYICNVIKPIDAFYKLQKGLGGVYSVCKSCLAIKNKIYRQANLDRCRANSKRHYHENKEYYANKIKTYRTENAEEIKKTHRVYLESHKDKINEHLRNRYYRDTQYRIKVILRSRLYDAVFRECKNGSAIEDLGCSIEFFKAYIEQRFEPGMTWDNWAHDVWHLDHIIPLASFDLTDREQLLKACHYTNIQPMWAKDNLSKGAKLNWKK